MDIHEVPLLEELVDGEGNEAPHPEHGLEGIGPGTQMGHGPQELQTVTLLLQGIVRGGGTLHQDAVCLHLKGLLGVGGLHDGAGDHQGGAHVGLGDLLEIIEIIVIHHLQGCEEGAVVQNDEAEGLAGPDGTNPAAHRDSLTHISGCVAEQLPNAYGFHRTNTSLCLNWIDAYR